MVSNWHIQVCICRVCVVCVCVGGCVAEVDRMHDMMEWSSGGRVVVPCRGKICSTREVDDSWFSALSCFIIVEYTVLGLVL